MTLLEETCARIGEPDSDVAAETQRRLDRKTKPPRSLGRLEDLACRLAAIWGDPAAGSPRKAIVVMGADHGVVVEGVSAYPQAVTRQMLLNFARGGAAINALARHAGARLMVVEMGVTEAVEAENICSHRIGPGTRNFAREAAMRREEVLAAIEVGIALAGELADTGVRVIGTGEMGIGNTTSSSALVCAFTGALAAVRLCPRATAFLIASHLPRR